MKKIIFGLFSFVVFGSVLFGGTTSAASAQTLADEIIAIAQENVHPAESLVQWYYVVSGLHDRVVVSKSLSDEALQKLENLTSLLREHLDTKKGALAQTGVDEFWNTYQDRLEGRNSLSSLCRDVYKLADDRSFALNLPTALTLGVLDMESSCRMSNPNQNGIFQIISNEYTSGPITIGHWISQMYDFNDFIHRNRARYHDANKLDIANCQYKDVDLVGQTAPICLSYANIDLDSVIKVGALYNGLKKKAVIDGTQESRIKGDIQPTNGNYVYGNFDQEHMESNKEGLIIRMLQVLQYSQEVF